MQIKNITFNDNSIAIKNILINEKGKTVGATLINNSGETVSLDTKQLLYLKENTNIKFTNATIDSRGYIRAKSGHLKKVEVMQQPKENKQKNYILMSQNTEVLSINRTNGVVEIYRDDLVPFDLYLETGLGADTFNNRLNFDWWCAHRILTLNREYSKNILNSCGLKQATTDRDKADIALKYKCLSLRDFYWVKEGSDKTNRFTWESVNLFDNSLSNEAIDIALNGKNITLMDKKLIDSDLSTDGVFPKAWYRKDKTFYLYKGDRNNSVNKEVYASKLLQQLGFNVLDYDFEEFNNQTVAKSKCFTNKETGYITAWDLSMNCSVYTDYKQYYMMILCDYLVGNSDRHQDNWGYLFNSRREIIGFAPIFDFNHAFEASENTLCLPEQLFNRHITMIEIARRIVKKYNIKLSKVPEINKYTEFVNNRITKLYK